MRGGRNMVRRVTLHSARRCAWLRARERATRRRHPPGPAATGPRRSGACLARSTRAAATGSTTRSLGGEAAQTLTLIRIAGGKPPGAVQWNAGQQVYERAKQGVIRNLDSLATQDHWRDVLLPLVVRAVTDQNHFYVVRIDIHGFDGCSPRRRSSPNWASSRPPPGTISSPSPTRSKPPATSRWPSAASPGRSSSSSAPS